MLTEAWQPGHLLCVAGGHCEVSGQLYVTCVWFEAAACVLKLNYCDGTLPLREVADLQVSLWLYSAMFLGKKVHMHWLYGSYIICTGFMEVTSYALVVWKFTYVH